MNLWDSMKGRLVAELTSADITGAMEIIARKGISIHSVQCKDELTVLLTLDRSDWKTVVHIAKRRGERLALKEKKGLFWCFSLAGKRPGLLIGCMILLWLILALPTRILFVRVEGNETVPSRQILAAAESCGISFGSNRREVRSEQVKNGLLRQIPQLQWAGVNTSGCVATISVREGNREEPIPKEGVSSLVAGRDGIILSCTVTAGSGQCAPGQAVRQGQVLISGYTDCGLLVKSTRAEGEIMAQTRRELTVKAPVQCRIRGPEEEIIRQYSLILGKKRINFANSSRICDASCGRMYEEYYITLPGGFTLPVALAVQTHVCRKTVKSDADSAELQDAALTFARDYLMAQMISGSIVEEVVSCTVEDGVLILDGIYICQEMIGQRIQEGIGEANGKNS